MTRLSRWVGLLRPHADLSDAEDQTCVERALRGEPDLATLPLAYAQFNEACRDGDQGACSTLGVMVERGLGVAADAPRAAALYNQACKAGNVSGCVNLGMAFLGGIGVKTNAARAAKLLRRGCDDGNARACGELGTLYVFGQGVDLDLGKAAELLDVGCDGQQADSCYRLGGLYEHGKISADPLHMMTLYENACAGGVGAGCDRLDVVYAAMAKVPAKVQHRSVQGCDLGRARDCAAAGFAYFNGEGVERNLDMAVSYLQKACSGGYNPSCQVIGPMLHGSCSRGDMGSCSALTKLARR